MVVVCGNCYCHGGGRRPGSGGHGLIVILPSKHGSQGGNVGSICCWSWQGVSVTGKHGAAAMMDVRGSQQEGDEISGGRITRQTAVKRAFMSSLPDWLPDVNKVHTPSIFNK